MKLVKHNGGLVRIKEALKYIRPAEENAARYILENPDEVVGLSIKELAVKSQSSQAAIIRLCKNIGVEGFKELKVRIAGDLQAMQSSDQAYKEISPNDDIKTLINSISYNNIYAIRQTLQLLDFKEVERAVEAIQAAGRIDFYGAAASQIIAQDAQQKFLRINKACTAYTDSHLQLTSSVTLTEKDVAVGISYSGETTHVLEAIKISKENNATTIGITRYGANPLASMVDICLTTSATESDIRSAATASRIAQLNIIDILFSSVASKNYHSSIDYLNKTRDATQNTFR
jgi:DNA-binding MurR/RpiR family transcriptional regulator